MGQRRERLARDRRAVDRRAVRRQSEPRKPGGRGRRELERDCIRPAGAEIDERRERARRARDAERKATIVAGGPDRIGDEAALVGGGADRRSGQRLPDAPTRYFLGLRKIGAPEFAG